MIGTAVRTYHLSQLFTPAVYPPLPPPRVDIESVDPHGPGLWLVALVQDGSHRYWYTSSTDGAVITPDVVMVGYERLTHVEHQY